MSKRKRGLTPEEIQKLLAELEDEEFDDSDSECELEVSEENNFDLSISANPLHELDISEIEEAEGINWSNPEPYHKANIFKFSGANILQRKSTVAVSEKEFFDCVFTDSVIRKVTEETNKYAQRLTTSRNVTDGTNKPAKRINTSITDSLTTKKHTSDWHETNEAEIKKFLALTLLMGHIEKDSIKEYWSTDRLLETPFFRTVMPRDRFIALLRFLYFEENETVPDKNSVNYDRLWKLRYIFDELNNSFKNVYEPSEELAVDEVIVSFKGRVIFKQYIPKKRKRFGIKVYKLVDNKGYTYDMQVYLGQKKVENSDKQKKSATHQTVTDLAECVKGKGHKLYMDNFFSSPALFVELYKDFKINSCGTMRQNRKNFPKDLAPRKMKKGDLSVKFGKGMTAMCWKDKREIFMLSNMHNPVMSTTTLKNNECVKPTLIESYNAHMGYVDLSDRMANSYTFGRKTLKWTKKLFFHLLDLAVLNAFILYQLKNGKIISHKVFRQNLIRQLVENTQSPAGSTPETLFSSRSLQPKGIQGSDKHWPEQKKVQRRCAVCKSKGISKRTSVSCKSCDVGLCINCFEEFHTK